MCKRNGYLDCEVLRKKAKSKKHTHDCKWVDKSRAISIIYCRILSFIEFSLCCPHLRLNHCRRRDFYFVDN